MTRSRGGATGIGTPPDSSDGRTLRWQLSVPAPGVVLGVDDHGRPAAVGLLGPEPVRVGVVASLWVGQFLAARLVGVGCELTVVTGRPQRWERLRRWTPDIPVTVVDRISRWPSEGSVAPRALLIDLPDPPSFGLGRAPWSTVVHLPPTSAVPLLGPVAAGAPVPSSWWQGTDVLIAGRDVLRPDGPLRSRIPLTTAARMSAQALAVDSAAGLRVITLRPAAHETVVLDAG